MNYEPVSFTDITNNERMQMHWGWVWSCGHVGHVGHVSQVGKEQ